MSYLTVVFEHEENEDFQNWFKEQINSRICCVKGNEDLSVRVNAWSVNDSLAELQEYRDYVEDLTGSPEIEYDKN